jgi:hypothetical protein
VAWVWPTSASWWEYYCANYGFASDNLAQWFDFYYWSWAKHLWEYYGTWTRFDNDNSGCWRYWNATNGGQYTLC